jgi:hypothetical protein
VTLKYEELSRVSKPEAVDARGRRYLAFTVRDKQQDMQVGTICQNVLDCCKAEIHMFTMEAVIGVYALSIQLTTNTGAGHPLNSA